MRKLRKLMAVVLAVCVGVCMAPVATFADTGTSDYSDAHVIKLTSGVSDGEYTHSATLDGSEVTEYDYTWGVDLTGEKGGDIENAPAEYYEGTKPSGDDAVYIAHDVYYYPEISADKFKKVNYDGEQEWAYYYEFGEYTSYIFGTLPVVGASVPTDMMHSAEEAYQNAVLHITEPGTYIIEGDWHGQIKVDLDEGDQDEAFDDENAKVKIVLNGVDVTCSVAPAMLVYSAYECDNTWEDRTEYEAVTDTSEAGADIIIADGTTNNFTGSNIYRMLKTKLKDDEDTSEVPVQKKIRKTDGAFYSYVTMNFDGESEDTGVLNITSEFEGLDTELHLTVNGGNINIYSQNDGINVNEDGVSTFTLNDGTIHIIAGLGAEGDGVDSNGFNVINGGTLVSMANPASDSGLDADKGTVINGGTVIALGSTMDWAEEDGTEAVKGDQAAMNLRFSGQQSSDEAIIVTDTEGNVVMAYDPDKDEIAGTKVRSYQGAILSCENIKVGSEYNVYVGGDVKGTETGGVYKASTVTGFTDAKQQCYTGEMNGGGPGMGQPGDGTEPPEIPDGTDTGDGTEPPEIPDGTDTGDGTQPTPGDGTEPPEKPDGTDTGDGTQPTPPDGADPGDGTQPTPPEGDSGNWTNPGEQGQTGTASTVFAMTSKVNGFSGVMDYTEEAAEMNFSDVKEGDWYYDSVKYVFEKGLMKGTSDTTFAPNATTNRAMIVTILYRLSGESAGSEDVTFTDVAEGSWYYDAVAWAAENKIVTGYSDTKFGPTDQITREQFATILYRYSQYKNGANDENYKDATFEGYTDASSVSSYAKESLAWANDKGIITGVTKTTLNPKGSATRAQAATILARFCEL